MISPAQQQLDEALTNGGHSDACPAFEGRRCPGPPLCHGNPVDEALYVAAGADRAAEQAKRPRLVAEVKPAAIHPALLAPDGGGVVTLSGREAVAFERWKAAARRLHAVDAEHKAATREYQEAHQAFADAVAGA